jgi:NAD(P)-dependent dehydrogenase (short-subunit alcohol dehydrogenase family)
MATPTIAPTTEREPELLGQTVVVIGGSAGIGLETARRAKAEGAEVVLTCRHPDRLTDAALELGAQRTAAFDANDSAALQSFFQSLPTPIDHVLITAGGPSYGPLLETRVRIATWNVWGRYGQALEPFLQEEWLVRDGPRLRLTREGMLMANEVMAVFV